MSAEKRPSYWLWTLEYPPENAGGISTYCWFTAQVLNKHYDFTVFVLDYNLDKAYQVDVEHGIRVVRFSDGIVYPHISMAAVNISRRYFDISQQVCNEIGIPDVIEVHDYYGIGFSVIHDKIKVGGPFANTKIIVTVHTPQYIRYPFDGLEVPKWQQGVALALLPKSLKVAFSLYKLKAFQDAMIWVAVLERYCLANADGVVFIAKYMQDLVTNQTRVASQKTIIANPYPCIGQNPDAREISDAGFIGKLSPSKGIVELVQMLEMHWQAGGQLRLQAFAGSHFNGFLKRDTLEHLQDVYSERFQQGLIVYNGKIEQSQLAEASNSFQLFFLPSTVENFPYALIEQMEFGKICIVSHTGGQAEIVEDGISGFVYHNAEEFATKLMQALALSEDERRSIALAAQKRVRELCEPETVIKQKDAFIRGLGCGSK